MNVLLLGAEWNAALPGGLNRYVEELVQALEEAHVGVRAVVAGPAEGAGSAVVAAGHHRGALPGRLLAFRRVAGREAAAASVVDAHFPLYALGTLSSRAVRRLPLVVHFHGPWGAEGAAQGEARWRSATKRLIEGRLYRRAECVITLSQAFADEVARRHRIAPWRVRAIPPGVDSERFRPGDRAAARAALGLAWGAFVVVAVRRLTARMGLDVLVRAWPAVAAAVPGARLVIVGDGPERTRLEALALAVAPPGVAAAPVRFLGRVDDGQVVRAYQAADVSVIPSVAWEGFGLVALEAMACGVPTLVSDIGGLPEAVHGVDASLVVPPGDPAALAARLVAAAGGALPAADRCRTHAERFSWAATAATHQAVYAAPDLAGRAGQLRVVHLDHCAERSGAELALARVLPHLPGVHSHVILAAPGPLQGLLRAAAVSAEVLPMRRRAVTLRRDSVRARAVPFAALLGAGTYTVRLAVRLRRLRPDVVHTNSLKAALYGGLAGRLAGVPVVWHVHDRISDDYLPRGAARLVRRAAAILPAAVIANSTITRDTLAGSTVAATVVPSPVADEFYTLTPHRRRPGAPLHVAVVGRISPWKGQHVFLEAFAAALPGGRGRAAIVGDALFGETAYADELRALVDRLGIAEWVEFAGFRADVGAVLEVSDVLVHCSVIPEPFGMAVAEGMAAGMAVVAADAGGPAEMIEHGRNGLLYPPGDSGALAVLLRRLDAEASLPTELGNRAREDAQRYRASVVAPAVAAVYNEVAERSRGAVARPGDARRRGAGLGPRSPVGTLGE